MSVLHGKDPVRYPVAVLCRLFGVTKQAYYKSPREPYALSQQAELSIVEFVLAERSEDPRIGCRKLWMSYVGDDRTRVSRRLFEAVVAFHGLMLRRTRRRTATTFSLHGLPTYPDLVRSLVPERPCQVWVADITYIRLRNPDGTHRFCYLSLITDAYSRYILGYCVGLTLEASYAILCLNMAFENSCRLGLDLSDLIHHSDRGVQYACAEYVGMLKEKSIHISMTESGNPKDNAQAERVNGIVKNELMNGLEFGTIEQVRAVLPGKIDYYNNRRLHMSIDCMTPAKALGKTGEIRKRWRSYRDEAIRREKNEAYGAHVSKNV